ncbi:MAG: aminoglycoside 3'-phosphotransferase [Defluviitaleaceae bacterium]|nr:aminoglycoside 3'-phosphotransferase [Defluviitaleaceae bacterium]
MILKPIKIDLSTYPTDLHPSLCGGNLFDSSCSPQARVIFIDKDGGYFLKSAAKGTLAREATMLRYFHGKGLAAKVLSYTSDTQDWLLTEKVHGDDCVAAKYLEHPKRLCDTLAEQLVLLHDMDYINCPAQNHTQWILEKSAHNKRMGTYNQADFPDSFGYATAEDAWAVVEAHGHILRNDTLLHGDYCLPNVILNDWQFSGFIDLDNAGVGDKHVDVFWATWSLFFNLHTHDYRQRFIDAYGRDKIDEDILRIVAAVEVFG